MKNIAAVAVAVIGLTAGAVGWATAGPSDSGTPAATTTTTAAAANRPEGGRGVEVLRRTVHGDLVVKQGDGFETVTFDRGMVTSVDASSLSLHRPDGVDVTVTLNDQTRYVGVSGAGGVQKDKPVTVISKDGTARIVAQRDGSGPAAQGGARPGPGAGARRPRPGTSTTTTAGTTA
ncbi:MAG: hypothetical protein QOE35_1062 [Actinomycetota bacterium]|jgi:hypothetical protein